MNNFINFEIFIIKTLPKEYFENCKDSLLKTTEGNVGNDQIQTIKEKGTREETLNTILARRNNKKDLFIVADDIIFLNGWFKSLINNYSNGDIIGFSMIDAKSGLLQDFGYDFEKIDGDLTYRGLYKHKKADHIALPEYRECDAITGCAMYISKCVLETIHQFPLEGANRWGEILFSHHARRMGFKTIVLGSHLEHFAISTKQKTSTKKSSLSWIIECDQWKNAVDRHLYDAVPVVSKRRIIDEGLLHLLVTSNYPLIYGCGTIADFILKKVEFVNVSVCSGLPEEIGADFHGKRVLDVNSVKIEKHDLVIITPIGYDYQIRPLFPLDICSRMIGIQEYFEKDKITYSNRILEITQHK